MSTTITTGWLNDKNGDKFAPKTLTSQVQTSDGVLIETLINNKVDKVSGKDLSTNDFTNEEKIKLADAVVSPSTASVGQTIIVKAVDENGKPTEWESRYYSVALYCDDTYIYKTEDTASVDNRLTKTELLELIENGSQITIKRIGDESVQYLNVSNYAFFNDMPYAEVTGTYFDTDRNAITIKLNTKEFILIDFTVTADNRAKVGYTGATDENLVIPATFKDTDGTWCKVVGIGNDAFKDCSGLTSVTIPNSVTSIGDNAFRNCTGLTGSLAIPNSVISIGNYAFYGSNLTGSLVIPDSVTSIGAMSFSNCTGLTSLDLGNGVQTINSSAFNNCSGLTGSLVIPDSVTSIGSYAFGGCSFVSIDIGSGATSISNSSFRNCHGLTSITVDVNNTVYHSDGNCLIETASKTLILGLNNSIIPSDGSVTSIGAYAFAYCTDLTSITIPDSVISTANWTFTGCTSLASITIPASMTTIRGLPTPSNSYIDGADGLWYSTTTGIGYAANSIPIGIADTYVAVNPTT